MTREVRACVIPTYWVVLVVVYCAGTTGIPYSAVVLVDNERYDRLKGPSYATRHRSEQHQLLVELELDDSFVLAHRHGTLGGRNTRQRSVFEAPSNDEPPFARHPWESTEDLAFETPPMRDSRTRPQSAKTRSSATGRDSGTRPKRMAGGGGRPDHLQHSAQQKLLSPYKLKQKVLSSRESPSPERMSHRRISRGSSPASRESPLSLLCDSFRMNAQLRDQLVAQLQQEVAADDDAVDASYHDRRKPEPLLLSLCVVKMLNKLRSLSLSVVEMHAYFQREILRASTESAGTLALAEREMTAYLLQMSSSDVDFLSCYAPLLRIVDRKNDVGIVRNPLVDGLSLDSSELLLCACNHNTAPSLAAPAYVSTALHAARSSSPLFQLLIHKLEAFAQFMSKHVPTWQVMPHDRVAAALLQLVEVETRANASRLLPAYLRSTAVPMPSAATGWERERRDVSILSSSSPSLSNHHETTNTRYAAECAADKPRRYPEAPFARPRSSFVAWNTVDGAEALPLTIQSNRVVEQDPEEGAVSAGIALGASAAHWTSETALPILAEAKDDSRARQPAKKRKGTAAVEEVVTSGASFHTAANANSVDDKRVTAETVASAVNIGFQASDQLSVKLPKPTDSVADEIAVLSSQSWQSSIFETASRVERSAASPERCSEQDSTVGGATLPVEEAAAALTSTSSLLELLSASDRLPFLPAYPSEGCEEDTSKHRSYRSEQAENSVQLISSEAQHSTSCTADPTQNIGHQSYEEHALSKTNDKDNADDLLTEHSSDQTLSLIATALALLPTFEPLGSPAVEMAAGDQFSPARAILTGSEATSDSEDALYPTMLPTRAADEQTDDTLCLQLDQPSPAIQSSHSARKTGLTEQAELEKIFALCRDVQFAAFDMIHHLDVVVIPPVTTSFSSLPSTPRHVPYSTPFEPPHFLERELKMLRRYFRPWRDAVVAQREAQRALRRRTASRLVLRIMQSAHDARELARIDSELDVQHAAAGRLHRCWKSHRRREEAAVQKVSFTLVHLAFKRVQFFVRLTKRYRRREGAKEQILRWWRRCCSAKRSCEEERTRKWLVQQHRVQAAKEVQRFCREAILRHRLARIAAEHQRMLFKTQLMTLKTRQEDEKRRRIESRRRRGQEFRTKRELRDLTTKWRQSERERSDLQDHHERVLDQYQRVDIKQRQEVARLKITAFIDTCVLRRKIVAASAERERNAQQWRLVALEKQALEYAAGQVRAADKLQIRVLQKQLTKLEGEKAVLCETHDLLVTSYEERVRQLRQHLAKTTVTSFVAARLVESRTERQKNELLRAHEQIVAEKVESERMACEDVAEHERRAQADMDALEALLTRAQRETAELATRHEDLRREKALGEAAAAKQLDDAVTATNRVIIAKWLTQQIRSSRERVRLEATRAEFARELRLETQRRLESERERGLLLAKRDEERRGQQVKANMASLQRRTSRLKQQQLADKRLRAAASSRICSFLDRRLENSRRVREAAQSRQEALMQRQRDREFEAELRRRLVEAIIDSKGIAECVAATGIATALLSIKKVHDTLWRKHTRLCHLRRSSHARKIQCCWVSWKRRREIVARDLEYKRQDEERKRRAECLRHEACARRIQRRWSQWRTEAVRRRDADAESVRQERLTELRQRTSARRIQHRWRAWREERRRRQVELAEQAEQDEAELTRLAEHRRRERAERLASIQRRASARRIQRQWRAWRQSVAARRQAAETLTQDVVALGTIKLAHANAIRRRVCARTIQRQWRQRIETRASIRHATEIAAELDRIYRRSCGRRILSKWRAWRRRRDDIRIVKCAVVIETGWRGYYSRQQFASVKAARQQRDTRLYELRISSFARKIQRCWGRRLKRVVKAKRAAVKREEDEIVQFSKGGSSRMLIPSRDVAAAVTIQVHWAGYRCRLLYVGVRRQLLAAFGDSSRTHWDPMDTRTSRAFRLGCRLEVQRWARHELPSIVTSGINSTLRRDHGARVVQRSFRAFCKRRQLRFSVSKRQSTMRVYLSGGRAWMTSNAYPNLRLRFSSVMTRRLALMLEPGAHTLSELNDALKDIAADAQLVFDAAQAASSDAGDGTHYIGVDELDLPSFGDVARKMGRVRSMHKRSMHKSQSSLDARATSHTQSLASCRQLQASSNELTVFDAVASASIEDAQFLLDRGADFAEREVSTGRTALHLLAFSTESSRFRLGMLEFLVRRVHADVNARDALNETPLMLFAACGLLELTKALARDGADLTLTNTKGQNALHRACEQDQVEVCGFLHESASRDEPTSGHVLHHADNSGRYPMHVLAEKGFVECAKQLLLADNECFRRLVGHRDANGRTPLLTATSTGRMDVALLILDTIPTADVDAYDNSRCSALHLAVDAPNAVQAISQLVDHNASVNAVDERGDSPLHWAALSGRILVVQRLLEAGADSSLPNSDWETPAQVAVAYGHVDCARVLLSAQKHCEGESESVVALEAELAQQQASGKSYYYKAPSPTASMVSATSFTGAKPSTRGAEYWEELHQEVQLVEESGSYSSEDEALLDDDADVGEDAEES